MSNHNENLVVDIHVLETLPYSCVNRDDMGQPKTAVYGGVKRARVSSQCWKAATRRMVKQEGWLDVTDIGIRSRQIDKLLALELDKCQGTCADEPSENSLKNARAFLKLAGIGGKDDKKAKKGTDSDTEDDEASELKTIIFVSPDALSSAAELIMSKKPEDITRAEAETVLQAKTADMMLFGRMVAQNTLLNVDACCQVAHALSTHAVSMDYDYYSAVDDVAGKGGAAFIDTAPHLSATMYRYASVNVGRLIEECNGNKDHAMQIVEAFVRGFCLSVPSGKQNSCAAVQYPDAVYISVRHNGYSLCNAFERPVKNADGYAESSCRRLVDQEKDSMYFAPKPVAAYAVARTASMREILSEVASVDTFDNVIGAIKENLR